jgi:hypothetical protein
LSKSLFTESLRPKTYPQNLSEDNTLPLHKRSYFIVAILWVRRRCRITLSKSPNKHILDLITQEYLHLQDLLHRSSHSSSTIIKNSRHDTKSIKSHGYRPHHRQPPSSDPATSSSSPSHGICCCHRGPDCPGSHHGCYIC